MDLTCAFVIQVEANTYHIFLADFGVSKVLHNTIATVKTNLSAASIGTPGYQPVEQLQAGIITESVDVYALGCVLIELFGGKRVWEGLSALQIVVKVVSEKIVLIYHHLFGDWCLHAYKKETNVLLPLKFLRDY